jgi:Fe2+ transport system protein FeoA
MRNGHHRHPFKKCKRHTSDMGCLPLTMAAPGKSLTLVEITAGNGLRHRLTELGLTPGVEFQILQSQGGPLLLAVHDSRLALGRGMAQKILVKIKEQNYD